MSDALLLLQLQHPLTDRALPPALFCLAFLASQAGAAGSWTVTNLGPKIVGRDFKPGFFVDHFVKVRT